MTSVALRQAYLLDTLGPYIVRETSTADWALFEDPSTPQAKALQWMSEDDTFSSDPESMEDQTLLERYALAVIGYATLLDSGDDSLHYFDPTSVCDWNTEWGFGVACDSNQTVTRLTLNWMDLTGTIPWEISLLENLVELSMPGNQLTGTLPAEMASLTALEVFSISGNYFSGTLPDVWGSGSIAKLSFLDLKSNLFQGTIPSGLLGLPRLHYTDLEDNNFSGSIPTEIGLSKMTLMILGNNNFSGSIPTEIGMLSTLTNLSLENNNFSGSIPTEIGMSMMNYLDLQNNNLSGPLPSEIAQLTELYIFTVSDNPGLNGTVPVEYGSLSHLNYFEATNTSLTGSLDAIFCLEGSTVFYDGLSFDCLGPDPEIECSCCYTCCDADGFNCEDPYTNYGTWAPTSGAVEFLQSPLLILVLGMLPLTMMAFML